MAAILTTILKNNWNFFSWAEQPIDSKLNKKYQGGL